MDGVTNVTVVAPCKDINKLKRKRSKSVSQGASKRCRVSTPPVVASSSVTTTAAATMDLEAILADLEDSSPNQAQVHYYTYGTQQQQQQPPESYQPLVQPQQYSGYVTYQVEPKPEIPPPPQQQKLKCHQRKLQVEPRLLMRQMYKLCNQADAVVGLESSCDFKASIYLVNSETSINFTIEDLLSVRSVTVLTALDNYFNSSNSFPPFHFNTVIVQPVQQGGAVSISNYQVRMLPHHRQQISSSDVLCQTSSLLLHSSGWNALKRVFDCIENYYGLCVECSPTVQNLIYRYCQYFSKHYKSLVMLAAANNNGALKVPPETERSIIKDLPLFLANFNERRLPSSGEWIQQTPLQESLLPWIDSEVRRFCSPNICETVLQDLKYDIVRW